MRRTYSRFPMNSDIDFDVHYSFADVAAKIVSMNGAHVSQRIPSGELVKLEMRIYIADGSLSMVPVEDVYDLLDTLTEEAHFMLLMRETILSGGAIPRAETAYYLRVRERGMMCECSVTKDGTKGATDAYDIKRLITGALACRSE